MFGFSIPAEAQPWVAMAILVVMFVLFVLERAPVEVTAIGGATLMLILGILPVQAAMSVLSNPAPWTIAMMFLVMGGMVRTGAIEAVVAVVMRHAGDRPRVTVVVLLGTIGLASAFMNNTPLVAVMIPVVMQLAMRIGTAPSKLLIPLSYMTVLGGMITLIGTSTNILVDGVAKDRGLEHFGLFEIAPLGIAVTLAGGAFLMLFGDRLLPARQSMGVLLSDKRKMKFFTEVAVPEASSLIGLPVMDVDIFKRDGVRVIDVLRGDASLRRDLASVTLEAGDRVVLRTEMTELMGLHASRDVHLVDKLSSVKTETVEVLIGPGCRMEGHRLGDLRLRRRYGVYVLAAHRHNQNIGRQLDDLVVRVGDTLLLEGTVEDIQRLAAEMNLLDVNRPRVMAYRRAKAPIVLAALALVITLSALNVAPILPLALIAVAGILITRCVDSDEAFSFVDGRLLAMIFAMLAVGEGLDQSGAVALIVAGVAPWLEGLGPFALILAVYFIGLVLTEFLSNNAVAVIYTPVAIQLADKLGYDPRPFVVAVMFSATLAFATPVGYQTNMMVYGPGGYRFSDFARVGIPLNIIVMLVASALIPVIWPL
ncbi:SLC13 family permease [Tabrizicola sp.]|uniref:SLC13 family permease n=1 Tax=Tabrizicola sp. TaxID=2005166 RepID=UPI000BD7AAD7|nr:SLC13 family permease [Tabrizicola sp.]MBY0350987.1 SLC13 family permease [Tabrizicola sp.]MDK2775563.1 SLC13 family permease [Tabrizicola sp.]OYX19336.1 MAG: dATP pyrophosphohydrolase [Rhodobacterales bacterium 32-66-9]